MESTIDVKEGDVLAGKYQVERVLGAGGMGIVVQAMHTVLNDRVALKFLLPELAELESTTARFLREAQAAARIKSPHVARVTDVGKLENGSPYMVMELLEGQDLGNVLEDGPLDVDTAILYVLQACEAVAAAHANGVIHRDIKPANLFLTQGPDQRPVVKMLDFGISKVSDRDGEGSLTQTSTAMGSPLYMSPEQMRSAKNVDGRTDVWSLGVVLYEMLTGTLPFVADTTPQVCALILETEPPPLREVVPDLPEGLDDSVRKAIARRVEDRYQDIAEFALAIAPYGGPAAQESAQRVVRILKAVGLGSDAGHGSLAVMPRPPAASTATSFGKTDAGEHDVAQRKRLLAIATAGIALIAMSATWAIYRISTPAVVASSPVIASQPAAPPPPGAIADSAVPRDIEPVIEAVAPSASEPPPPPKPAPRATVVRRVPPARTKVPPKPAADKSPSKPVNLDDRE